MESLGEMERKRSYQRDTVVLALPVLTLRIANSDGKSDKSKNWINQGKDGKGGMERGSDRSDAQRGVHALSPITTYSRPEVRKRVIGSVTVIDSRLKTQRATAMRQRRVSQMPDFHKSLPTPGPFLLGRGLRRSRRETNYLCSIGRLGHEGANELGPK